MTDVSLSSSLLSQFPDDYPFPKHLDFTRRPQSTLAEKDDQVLERVQEE